MMIAFFILLSITKSTFCAICGSSLIPYTFETLPTGGTVLGCARPSCFGWRPDGMPLPSAASFSPLGEQFDGFERESPDSIQYYEMSNSPQTADCEESFGSTSCVGDNQWVGGVIPNFNSTQSMNTLQCCSYEPLRSATNRGIATVRAGEVVIGGEVNENGQQVAFEYISDIEKSTDEAGNTIYLVGIRRFPCLKPIPPPIEPIGQIIPPQQPAPFIPQAAQYPIQSVSYPAAQSYYCFTADMMVNLKEGSNKRMDQLKIGDYVETIGEFGPEYSRVDFWIHRVPDQVAEFRKIMLEDGGLLKLTNYHNIYKTSCSESKFVEMEDVVELAVFAIDVEIGDCVYKYENNGIKMVKVSNITNIMDTGIYSPMTGTGTILVNNYHSSCHTVIDNHELQFSFFKMLTEINHKFVYLLGSYDQENALRGASTIIGMMEFLMPKSFLFK